MKSLSDRLDCYIAGFTRPISDNSLRTRGMATGMVTFAIPAYGVLFKCRARGERLELEVGALLALLRFLGTSLKDENITKIRLLTSDAHLVFRLAHDRAHLTPRVGRQKKLERYFRTVDVIGAYVAARNNRALQSPADLPSLPQGQESPIKLPERSKPDTTFGPFRSGVDL